MNIELNKLKGEFVSIPKDTTVRRFESEKTGRKFCEITLPDNLPVGVPEMGGWHFFMPGTCVDEHADAAVRLWFPTTWRTFRFHSPYIRGKRGDVIEYPLEVALAILRNVFEA